MPIASSSAMCLSRATGSRPVQPAMTARSIASVSGVVVPCASTVNVRSNTDDILHSGRKFKDAAIRSAGCRQHQTDRGYALAMRGQRYGAAINHVDQRAVAQRQQVRLGKGLVVGKVGDPRRRNRGGRHYKRVIRRETSRSTRDQRSPRPEQIDIVGGAKAFAAQDPAGNAGIVDVTLAGEEIAVPGVAL